MYELSLVELESELSALLPARELMCHRARKIVKKKAAPHGHGGTSAGANNGSVANANSTDPTINAPQTAVLTGVNGGGLVGVGQNNAALVAQVGLNRNTNSNTQFGAPVNFQG